MAQVLVAQALVAQALVAHALLALWFIHQGVSRLNPRALAAQRPASWQQRRGPPKNPKVWRCYLAYSAFMAVLCSCCAGLGAWLLYMSSEGPLTDAQGIGLGALISGVSGVLALGYCAAPFILRPRWSWAYHTLLLVLGICTGLGLPFAVPLLIWWLRAETRALFENGELH